MELLLGSWVDVSEPPSPLHALICVKRRSVENHEPQLTQFWIVQKFQNVPKLDSACYANLAYAFDMQIRSKKSFEHCLSILSSDPKVLAWHILAVWITSDIERLLDWLIGFLLDLIGRSPKNNTDWIRLERFYFEPVPSGCLSLSMVIQESISVNSSTLVKRIF